MPEHPEIRWQLFLRGHCHRKMVFVLAIYLPRLILVHRVKREALISPLLLTIRTRENRPVAGRYSIVWCRQWRPGFGALSLSSGGPDHLALKWVAAGASRVLAALAVYKRHVARV